MLNKYPKKQSYNPFTHNISLSNLDISTMASSFNCATSVKLIKRRLTSIGSETDTMVLIQWYWYTDTSVLALVYTGTGYWYILALVNWYTQLGFWYILILVNWSCYTSISCTIPVPTLAMSLIYIFSIHSAPVFCSCVAILEKNWSTSSCV